MTQTLPAEQISLYDLEEKFNLQEIKEPAFFPECANNLPNLTPYEQQRLERVKAAYTNLARRAVLENTVKLAIISPLLDLAGFFLAPFYITTEQGISITSQDEEITIRGRIDILVLKDRFWLLVIESKRAEFSVKVGIPQVLSYMLANPNFEFPLYGLVTNGSNFVFLKLLKQEDNYYYARSSEFVLENPQNLETVLQVLKNVAGQLKT